MHTINDIPKQQWKDGVFVDYTEQERQELLEKWNEDAERIKQHNNLKYQRDRAAEYPSFADQFDTIFHEGVDAWKAQIQVIKDKYPKAP